MRVMTSGAFTSQDVPRPAVWQHAAMPRACTGCISHVGGQEQALRAVSSEVAWLTTLHSHFAVHCSLSCCMHSASCWAWHYLVVAEQHQCICLVKWTFFCRWIRYSIGCFASDSQGCLHPKHCGCCGKVHIGTEQL